MTDRPYVDATFYAQVEPEWSTWQTDNDGHPLVCGAKLARTTQKKPEAQRGGTVLVKLTMRIPTAAFMPLRPAAVVVIPEDMTAVEPVEVVAEDPTAGDS